MSLSAMPAALITATTLVIAAAASVRAALAVGRWTTTPRRRSAVSGVIRTRPTPVTEIVCCSGVSAARAERGPPELMRARPTIPVPMATATQRIADAGTEAVTVRDIWETSGTGGRRVAALGLETNGARRWFRPFQSGALGR